MWNHILKTSRLTRIIISVVLLLAGSLALALLFSAHPLGNPMGYGATTLGYAAQQPLPASAPATGGLAVQDGDKAGNDALVNAPVQGQGTLTEETSGESDFSQTNLQQRVVLKNATLSITVKDTQAKLNEIAAMASEMGGWVVTSNTSKQRAANGQDLTYGNITVRIPADKLDTALGRVKDAVVSVDNENVTGQDVTQQYVDMSSRLKNLEVAEQQLQTLMDRATKVEDVLAIYNQLVSTRGEIESIKGQLQYFDEAAAFSSIQITLSPELPGVVEQQAAGWTLGKTIENALGALVSVVQSVVDVVVSGVIVAGPFVVIFGIPAWIIIRRRRAARRAAVPA